MLSGTVVYLHPGNTRSLFSSHPHPGVSSSLKFLGREHFSLYVIAQVCEGPSMRLTFPVLELPFTEYPPWYCRRCSLFGRYVELIVRPVLFYRFTVLVRFLSKPFSSRWCFEIECWRRPILLRKLAKADCVRRVGTPYRYGVGACPTGVVILQSAVWCQASFPGVRYPIRR